MCYQLSSTPKMAEYEQCFHPQGMSTHYCNGHQLTERNRDAIIFNEALPKTYTHQYRCSEHFASDSELKFWVDTTKPICTSAVTDAKELTSREAHLSVWPNNSR